MRGSTLIVNCVKVSSQFFLAELSKKCQDLFPLHICRPNDYTVEINV